MDINTPRCPLWFLHFSGICLPCLQQADRNKPSSYTVQHSRGLLLQLFGHDVKFCPFKELLKLLGLLYSAINHFSEWLFLLGGLNWPWLHFRLFKFVANKALTGHDQGRGILFTANELSLTESAALA